MRYGALLVDNRRTSDMISSCEQVEQLSQTLAYRVADLEQQATDAEPELQAAVDGAFKSDDKLLASLQKLGWELDRPDPEEAQAVDDMREGCMRYGSAFYGTCAVMD